MAISYSIPAENLEISCLFHNLSGLVLPEKRISSMRLISEGMKEESVSFRLYSNTTVFYFESKYLIKEWLRGQPSATVVLQTTFDDGTYDLRKIPLGQYKYQSIKESKLAKIYPFLACPACKHPLENKFPTFTCLSCNESYSFDGNAFCFLTDELKSKYSITPTDNISAHGYVAEHRKILEENPDKLYLDCGAGQKSENFQNQINLEIVNYASTDILAIGEELPFLDNTFDGVFSLVVLEHVKDPFKCANEIMRVLKPGGLLFCEVPFLQPFHAYPHHYFNMTQMGLMNIFSDLNNKECIVPDHLHPMAALTWILNAYTKGLPGDLQQKFINSSIFDIIKTFEGGKNFDKPLVQQLSKEMRTEIACGNRIIGYKK